MAGESLKFLIRPAVEPERLDKLRSVSPSSTWVNARDDAQALAEMPGTDAFLGKITPELLARADKLRWVQTFTVSLEHYLFPELVAHPSVMTNMRGLFGDVIADQVMGYVICFARNLHTYIRRQVERRYEPIGGESARVNNAAGPGTVNDMDRATLFLPEKTMGIVGVGAIGAEIARRALAFGMTVQGVDRHPDRVSPPAGMAKVEGMDRLPRLLETSDFVVIAAPHTPETARSFDASALRMMRPTSYLINIGRGAILVLDDLVAALREGRIAGAALDVFEIEPLPSSHPLWDFPNVILTPHTAGYSTAIAGRHLATLLENVGRFSRGEALINVVSKSAWY